MKLSAAETKIVNNFAQFASYKYTDIGQKFLYSPLDVLALFFGNQAGKGALVVINYILRIMGYHPVARKNMLYYKCEQALKYEEVLLADDETEEFKKRLEGLPKGHYYSPANIIAMKLGDPHYELYSKKYICPECQTQLVPHIRQGAHRIIRFASQSMPGSETTTSGKGKRDETSGMGETKNTQYIEFMKWLPQHMLRDKKISVRDATQRIWDPYPTGMDIVIEYISFNQMTQSSAGVQRASNWIDELMTKEKFDEQVPRMMSDLSADIILSYTVTKEVGYLFDLIWDRAKYIYRSKSVVDFYRKEKKQILPRYEETDSEFENIAVFHASSFDNPTIPNDRIRSMMKLLHDDCNDHNVMQMRLYCIFSEISSFIFPSFNMRTHVIDPKRYFTEKGEIILN